MPYRGSTHPATRDRMASATVSGGISRIRQGAFGVGNTAAAFETNPNSDSDGLYQYHEGDLFSPGAGNWVFEPNFELPLITIWGNAFLRRPNTFKVYQPTQVMSFPNVVVNGIGGLEAGQWDFTALGYEEPGYEGGGLGPIPTFEYSPSQVNPGPY